MNKWLRILQKFKFKNMKIAFTKMHGAGNDFVCIDNSDKSIALTKKQIQFLCDRHFGIGADGVILMEKYYTEENKNISDIFMNYYNADGTTAEMCGNGVRVTAHFAKYFWNISKSEILVETRSGIKPVSVNKKENNFTVNMGSAQFENVSDYIGKNEEPVNIENTKWYFASMGNPHAVGFFENSEEISEKIEKIGAIVENSVEFYPNKINVNFVAPIDLEKNKFQVSTFERGAGVTLACGTGASASFSHILKKYPNIQNSKNTVVEITVPGGTLFFTQDEYKNIFMTGPSVIVFSGEIEL